MKILAVIFLIIFAGASVGVACSISYKPFDKFDSEQYVFIGSVAEIVSQKYSSEDFFYDAQTKRYSSKTIVKDGYGLRIRLTENIFLPAPQNSYDVFPLYLTASCGLIGWEEADVLEAFPIGSKVAVVATEPTLYAKKTAGEIKVLEINLRGGSLNRLDTPGKTLQTSADSVFNYKALSKKDSGAVSHPLNFELHKDLLRLQNAARDEDKVDIIERLLYYPYFWRLDFTGIVEREIKDAKTRTTLTAQWEEIKQKRLDKN